MKFEEKFGLGFALTMIGLLGAGVVGWCMNIQNLMQYEAWSNKFIVSLVGVFIPIVGAVTGYLW